jgi:hypothetical protein
MQGDQIRRDVALAWKMLGPQPEEALRALVDLGLDDHEIGRYNAVLPAAISTLRKRHCIIATTHDKSRLRQFALLVRSKLFVSSKLFSGQ